MYIYIFVCVGMSVKRWTWDFTICAVCAQRVSHFYDSQFCQNPLQIFRCPNNMMRAMNSVIWKKKEIYL